MENLRDDDIVISGISGSYPESENIQELQDNLFNGVDMVTDSHPRWSTGVLGVPPKIGKMKNISKCDAQYFGIVRKNCNSLDPVSRQILERCFEALFDAGINPVDLKGSNTGVFVNTCISEAEILLVQSKSQETYGIMGRNRALNANRLSYWLDLKGPSYSSDCTWNGGIQIITQAYHAIKTGLCDAAIVGSGSIMVHPQATFQFQKLNLLSPDAVTRSFDIDANGYARSEAVSVLVIQKAKDARRSYGSIVHVANEGFCNIDSQLIEPRQENWLKFLETFYSDCNIDPNQVAYLEAYGSGNVFYDAAELNACADIFGKDRTPSKPFLVGAIKSNMGHTEAASNLSSLAKLCIALQTNKIPANLHYNRPNPLVRDLIRGNLKVVSETTELNGDFVALNSFGFGGTYGHLLLKKHSREKCLPPSDHKVEFPRLILLSARHQEGYDKIVQMIENQPYDPEYLNLINKSFREELSGHMYRGYVTVPQLDPLVKDSQNYSGAKRPLWFVFTGMGSQWTTMGRDLMCIPHFRKAIEQCHNILKPKDLDLLQIILSEDATTFDNILHCFVGIISIQIALVDCIKQLGLKPDGIIGHSVGETAASYCDGCLTLEQTLLAGYYRGKVSMDTEVIHGMMAAVGKGYQEMKDKIPNGIEIACHNGPDSCTLSGPTEQIKEYVNQLKSEGVFAKTVSAGNIPYHSKYIAGMGNQMKIYLNELIPEPKERSSKWISTSMPERLWNEDSAKLCSGDYHANNLLNPVLFEEGCKHIPENAITLEIAPHGLMQAILRRSLNPKCTNIALTNKNSTNQLNAFLTAIGKLFVLGLQPDVNNLYPPMEYPVSRGTPFLSPLVTWDHSDTWSTFSETIEEDANGNKTFKIPVDLEITLANSYKFDGVGVVPESTYINLVIDAYTSMTEKVDAALEFRDITFFKNVIVDKVKVIIFDISIQPGTGWFEISHNEQLIVNGFVVMLQSSTESEITLGSVTDPIIISNEDIYEELRQNAHEYDILLKTIKSAEFGSKDARIKLHWQNNLPAIVQGLLQVQLLKACEKSGCSQKLFKIRQVVIRRENEPQAGSFIEAEYNYFTQAIRSSHIEIYDPDFKPVTLASPTFTNIQMENIPPACLEKTLTFEKIQSYGSNVNDYQIGFTALDEKSNRVIGLGHVCELGTYVKKDAILLWEVPTQWSSDEAVTVPLPFAMAYHALYIEGQVIPSDTVLVTYGCNPLGIAALKVALNNVDRKLIYTSVTSEADKTALLKIIPQLEVNNIFVTENFDQLALLLRSVANEGITLLLNTGNPNELNLLANCAGKFSRIIEMSDLTFETRGKFHNTITLLNSVSIFNGSKISNREDDKLQLKELMAEGIKSGLVKPIPTIVSQTLLHETTLNYKATTKSTRKYTCEEDKAYLILGGESYTWLTIVDWFVHRRAKHILVVHQSLNLTKNQQSKLQKLQGKCNLIVKTAVELTPQLIQHIYAVSKHPIALAILIQTERPPNAATVQALAKQDSFLVSIVNPSTDLSTLANDRKRKSTVTVLWKLPLATRIQGFLKVFDSILAQNNECNFIRVDDGFEEIERYKVSAVDQILPRSITDILHYVKTLPGDTVIRQLTTRSLPYGYVREVLPIFLIPGLTNGTQLSEKLQALLYPTFIVEFPSLPAPSLEQFITTAISKMKRITNGPYVIMGDSWGGLIALKIASALEDMGEETQVILLGGTPAEVLRPLKDMWESIDHFESGFLSQLFDIKPETISQYGNWQDKLHAALGANHSEFKDSLRYGLESIKNKLEAVWNFNYQPLKGKVLCVYASDVKRLDLIGLSEKEMTFASVDSGDRYGTNILDTIHDFILLKHIPRQRKVTC